MTNEMVEQINVDMECLVGEGGISLTNTSLGGTQITLGAVCIGHADLETIDELIKELRFLRDEVYYVEARARHQARR